LKNKYLFIGSSDLDGFCARGIIKISSMHEERFHYLFKIIYSYFIAIKHGIDPVDSTLAKSFTRKKLI